ncbi:MAG: response regulator [Acidobacteria bacterium]|nr:response regulator [Acidobacteriota bacterium]
MTPETLPPKVLSPKVLPPKVLLVDDDKEFRTVAALVLESAGYQVIEAVDGLTALEALRTETPDVIISDLHMPVMDGRMFCKRVRAESELAVIPFVILSAYIESDGSNNLSDTPADYCFSKQSSFASLLPQLENLIARTQK